MQAAAGVIAEVSQRRPRTEKENHVRISRITEFPVDRQTQHVAVETAAPAKIGRPQ
jgi:hypothetical protein